MPDPQLDRREEGPLKALLRALVGGVSRTVDNALLLLFILLFLIGGYAMYDTWLLYEHAQDRSVLKYKPESPAQAEEIQQVFPDSVAWLSIEDTGIDYPVMQGINNEEYLNKDPFGNFSLSGSIFLDSRNAPDFSDGYSLIYGHHMDHGAMFGALDAFLEEEYFDAHRSGTLTLSDGRNCRITLFAACLAEVREKRIFSPTENEGPMDLIREDHVLWRDPPEGRIIALSTCRYPETTARIVVFGVLEDYETHET